MGVLVVVVVENGGGSNEKIWMDGVERRASEGREGRVRGKENMDGQG